MGQVDTDAEQGTGALVAPPVAPAPAFCWEYVNGIDAKARVVLPAPYRAGFADGGYLTVWQERCLAAMPTPEFHAYVDHIARQLGTGIEEDPGEVLRELWARSVELKLDVQGRLSLPDALRSHVGIGSEVRFVGFGRRVELWPAVVSAADEDERRDLRATIALLQADYDVPRHGS